MVEEDTVVGNKTATSNNDTVEAFTPQIHQNNQPLLRSTPKCDSDSPSMMTSSNGTIVDDHNELTENSLSLIQEDEIVTSSLRPNRKMGVTTAVNEGKA